MKFKQSDLNFNHLSPREEIFNYLGDVSGPSIRSSLLQLNTAGEVKNKMVDFSSFNRFNSCNSIFALSEAEDGYFFIMNTNVKIMMKSSFNEGTFAFEQPGHVIIAREEEMKQMANMMNSEWKGSLVMQRLLKHKISSNHQSKCASPKLQDVSIQLETTEHEYSTINWSSALKKSIELFYKSGVISIFNDSSGRDMVLALKFLKLLYTPNRLNFESFGTYLKFKLWSDYVVCRRDIAMWVKKCLVQNYSQHKYMFVTHPALMTNATFYCHGQRCEHLHGGLQRFFNNPNASYTGELLSNDQILFHKFSCKKH